MRATGLTAFELRTELAKIHAQAPGLPIRRDDSDVLNILPPFINKNAESSTISTELEDRTIHSDPRELWYLALPHKLTPQQCIQILRSALGGDIFQSWQLCALMRDTWPVFAMASHQLREAVAYAKYVAHPFCEDGEEPSEKAKEKAGLVARAMKSFEPDPFNDEKGFSGMVYDLADAMLNGLSMVELLWQDVVSPKHGRERLPRASAWVHPRHFTFTNDGFIAVFDDTYARLYHNPEIQTGHKVGQSPDPKKFLCAQFISRSGSALGAGFMRPLVLDWAGRQFNNEWMLNTAKQYGSPFLDITYKPGTTQAEIDALKILASKAGPERRLVHLEGTTAQIVPPTSLGKENPQRYLSERADQHCLWMLLGQTGTTQATAGKLGNDDTHQDVKKERVQGLANWLSRNPLRQFARAVLMANYGECSECPEIAADFTQPLSSAEVAALATGMRSSGLAFRADEAYKELGFTQPEPGDIVVKDGVISVQGEPLSDEEKFEQQLEQQTAMGESQIALQQEAEGGPAQASAAGRRNNILKALEAGDRVAIHSTLLKVESGKELDEIEQLILAAEQAPHKNGEVKAVQDKFKQLAERQ